MACAVLPSGGRLRSGSAGVCLRTYCSATIAGGLNRSVRPRYQLCDPTNRRGCGGHIVLGTNSLIVVLLVGLIAGWLASKIVNGTGLGIIADIIIGVIGAFIGRWLFTYFHIRVGVNFWVDAILTATAGAIVLLVVIRLIKRA